MDNHCDLEEIAIIDDRQPAPTTNIDILVVEPTVYEVSGDFMPFDSIDGYL